MKTFYWNYLNVSNKIGIFPFTPGEQNVTDIQNCNDFSNANYLWQPMFALILHKVNNIFNAREVWMPHSQENSVHVLNIDFKISACPCNNVQFHVGWNTLLSEYNESPNPWFLFLLRWLSVFPGIGFLWLDGQTMNLLSS